MKTQTIKPVDLIVNTLTALLSDVGNLYQMNALDIRLDSEYVRKRIYSEGISFATKTLPAFGKHIDLSLSVGKFAPFTSFKKDRNGVLPLFLRGLTTKVFHRDGTLLDNPDCIAVRDIRQVCFMYYKLGGDYPQELTDECIKEFVRVDQSLAAFDNLEPSRYGYIYTARKVIKRLFESLELDIYPRPGPGQNSTKTPMEYRFEPQVLYKELHEVYPYYRYYYCNTDHLLDSVRKYKQLPRQTDGCSRLTTVPKDSRGPRIICMEPPEYMWFQQGLRQQLYDFCENHPIMRGHVNFTDQTINGRLALSSSVDGRFATLDMKEASDRISRDMVDELFDEVPKLRDRLLALSTNRIELPDGTILHKKKYAPMGSALCFPVMSIVHFVLACSIIMVEQGVSLREASRKVYVYGDDLIVASDVVPYILDGFPLYDLVFNVKKSFTQGYFRESCGVDAFKGINVTPTRVKTHVVSVRDPRTLVSALAHFHSFFNKGYWRLAKCWQDLINQEIALPCVSKSSRALGWIVPKSQLLLANAGKMQYCDKLQSPFLRGRVLKTKSHKSMIGGWEQMLRSQLSVKEGSSSVLTERDHVKLTWSRIPLSSL